MSLFIRALFALILIVAWVPKANADLEDGPVYLLRQRKLKSGGHTHSKCRVDSGVKPSLGTAEVR